MIQVKDDVGLDQDGVYGGVYGVGGKQLYSRYILKVKLIKFADRLDMRCEEEVKVFVRMELPFTEIEWIQLGRWVENQEFSFGCIKYEMFERHIQVKMLDK